jgi:hypothetical protein
MTQFDDIIVTPVYGPLNSSNAPNVIPKMNLGVLSGVHPNPPKFYPANGSSEFSNARREYARTVSNNLTNPYGAISKNSGSCNAYAGIQTHPGSLPQYGKSNKYIAPQSSSQLIAARKKNAVGKSSFKQGLPISAPLSYKSYNTNDVKNALRVTRGGGYAAPAKKGSIYNSVVYHPVPNAKPCILRNYKLSYNTYIRGPTNITAYIVLTIDINNYYDIPSFGGYIIPPWLKNFQLYINNGGTTTLSYNLSDLTSVVFRLNGRNNVFFTTKNIMSLMQTGEYPGEINGVSFLSYDNKLSGLYEFNSIIDYNYNDQNNIPLVLFLSNFEPY